MAVVDSNCDPEGIAFPIPGNDDAGRAIQFYCDAVSRAVIDGIARSHGAAGIDVGGLDQPPAEEIPAEAAAS